MNIDLDENNITTLKECVSTNANPNPANKRSPDDNRKDPAKKSNTIVFPAFDISTKRVGFGNGNARVTTVAYEIRCHLDHATLLKSIFIQVSVLDPYLLPKTTPTLFHTAYYKLHILSPSKTKSFNRTDSWIKPASYLF